jgi:hypothetical protein
MGNLIHYENWDSVTAPAIPSGWAVSSPLVTKTAPWPSGINPLSPPNVLAANTTGTTTNYPATYSVADSAGGNVLVYASFNAAGTSGDQTWGVFARGSAYPLLTGSSSYYWARLSVNPAVCGLYAVVNGTASLLQSVNTGSALTGNVWYQLQLSCEQSTIAVSVVRGTDGYSLNSSGSFQAGSTVAIAVSDTSVTGSGYAGLTLEADSDSAFTDEWYFYQFSGSSQPPPLQGQPIVQRANRRGRIIQPICVRFGTPIFPLSSLRNGIAWRDPSRRIRSIDRGWVWPIQQMPGVPPVTAARSQATVKRRGDSEVRRRSAPGRAMASQPLALLQAPQPVPLVWWKTIRSLDRSGQLRRAGAGWVWCPTAVVVPGSSLFEGWTQQYITSVNPPVQYGTELYLSWESNPPSGLVFQVYENGQLVWRGRSTYCTLPLPQSKVRFDIGTVGSAEATVSFAEELPPAPLLQAKLTWLGGTFEAPDIAGFHVYGEESPGAGVDYTNILATIPAYTAGVITDGYGYGGFGQGGFGVSAGSYSWISDALSAGTWHFAVVPFDSSGNEGTGATTAVSITAPPLEPAPFSDRSRLQYVWSPTTGAITLAWNASPG